MERAGQQILQTEHYWPTPAKFIELARPKEDFDLKVEIAWQRLRECLARFGSQASLTASDLGGDEAALWAAHRIGWERLGEKMGEEMGVHYTDNRPLFRAEFVRLYRVALSERASLLYLPGRLERQNRNDGRDLSPAAVGRLDWKTLPATCPAKLPPVVDFSPLAEMAEEVGLTWQDEGNE